ncbi:MAG TPA: ABC transporter permease [Steroidobacteraceae bacterium]|nr:ABC transporter permease [Steroidobacteraceae bacterium]
MLNAARPDQIFVLPRYYPQPFYGMPIAMAGEIERVDGVAAVGSLNNVNSSQRGPGDWIVLVNEGMRDSRPDAPVTPAQWKLLFSTPTSVLVSRDLAKKFDLKPGDSFPVTTLREEGSTTYEFQVQAVVPEDPQWGQGMIWGNQKYLDNTAPLPMRNKANIFWISIKDAARATEISRAIDLRFANSPTPTYSIPVKADRQTQVSLNINQIGVMLGVAGAGLFMVLFLVANAVARSVHERLPEFAVLHTLGFRESRLRRLVILEAAFPCVLGAMVGTALAGILMTVPARKLSYNLSLLLAPTLSSVVLAWAIAASILLALLSSVLPLLKLKRTHVADVLAGR